MNKSLSIGAARMMVCHAEERVRKAQASFEDATEELRSSRMALFAARAKLRPIELAHCAVAEARVKLNRLEAELAA